MQQPTWRVLKIGGWAALIVLATSTVVAAHTLPQGIDLQFRGSASESYDSNITYSESKAKEDLITLLSVGFDLVGESRRSRYKLSGDLSQEFFATHSDFNNTAEALSFEADIDLSKQDRITLKETFTHADEPRSFEDELGRSDGRYSYYRSRFSVEYEREISRRLGLSLRYFNELDDVTRDDLRDSVLHGGRLEARYYSDSATLWLLAYDYGLRDLDPGGQATVQTLGAGLRRALSQKLHVDTFAGVTFSSSFNEESTADPLFSISLTDQLTDNSKFSLAFLKKATTNAYTDDLFDQWQVSAHFSSQILKRLQGDVTGFYGYGEYQVLASDETLYGARMNLRYDLTPEVIGTLGYKLAVKESNQTDREYTKSTVLFGVSTDF